MNDSIVEFNPDVGIEPNAEVRSVAGGVSLVITTAVVVVAVPTPPPPPPGGGGGGPPHIVMPSGG
ncbi:MAG: hypothetical protein FWC13_09120 [Oscillospiraceae bacterium]|nr:hypothetical protein [Oscillospiraceae bacterium]